LRLKGQGHWERKCKIVFRACRRQKWIGLRQTETKIINCTFYIYRRIDFITENAPFCDICLQLSGRQGPSVEAVARP